MDVSKNRGNPKMDGENNGKPENPIKMDDLGENPYFWKHPYSIQEESSIFHCPFWGSMILRGEGHGWFGRVTDVDTRWWTCHLRVRKEAQGERQLKVDQVDVIWSNHNALRLHGMSWGVKTTCFKALGVSLGGSGVSIGGVRSLRVASNDAYLYCNYQESISFQPQTI